MVSEVEKPWKCGGIPPSVNLCLRNLESLSQDTPVSQLPLSPNTLRVSHDDNQSLLSPESPPETQTSTVEAPLTLPSANRVAVKLMMKNINSIKQEIASI